MLGILKSIQNRCVRLQPPVKEPEPRFRSKHLPLKKRNSLRLQKNDLSCWLSTNSFKPILRQKLNPDQILRSRWVLTWKDGESVDGKPAQKGAKARLVVLGHIDPQMTNVVRDSPTLSRDSRHTILQCLALGIDQFRYQKSLLERQGRCFQSTGYGASNGTETKDEPHGPTGLRPGW